MREVIEAALHRHQTPSARISVALVDDVRMAHLNKLHLGHEGPTDVLAFDLRDDPPVPPLVRGGAGGGLGDGAGGLVEGEIVVSVDTAVREADKRGHSVEAELALYTVHGMLHLLGYDDQHEHDASRMHEVEDEILTALGLGAVYRVNPP
ncbi:MAG: rRNA maturation RNase YbeY [Phycisphaerae bacterium]